MDEKRGGAEKSKNVVVRGTEKNGGPDERSERDGEIEVVRGDESGRVREDDK